MMETQYASKPFWEIAQGEEFFAQNGKKYVKRRYDEGFCREDNDICVFSQYDVVRVMVRGEFILNA
jgi:hypothetical protein